MKRTTGPPRLAKALLYRFLRDDLAEDVSGDLEERFHSMRKEGSGFRAKLDYWYQVIAYMRPFAIRKRSHCKTNPVPMYRNYVMSSIRSMKKNKLHAGINIIGLSVAMAVVMIIGLWIRDERSFEKHFGNYERIGWVLQHVTNNGEVDTWWSVPMPLAEELRKNYGNNFSHVVLTSGNDNAVLSFEDKHLMQQGMFAEPGFPDLFTLNMVHGSRKALEEPSALLISETLSRSYFGDEDPIGRVMTINNEMTVHVAGVYRDIPRQSELKDVHFVAPWQLLYNHSEWIRTMHNPWRPNAFTLYVGIAENHSFEQVSAAIRDAKLKKIDAELAKKKPELFVHPMPRWHLHSRFEDGKYAGGLITYVWLFGIIAAFVASMACINFMNLSTARSEGRAKEVGIRKAIGSYRSQLMEQFLSESVVTALFSFVIAVAIVWLSLPAFNLLAGKDVTLPWNNITVWVSVLGFTLFIGFLAGSYPAVYLSSITPGKALKGAFRASGRAALPRKVMVVTQFAVSVIMIVGTIVVWQQVEHARNRPIGYQTSGLLSVQNHTDRLHRHLDAVREELTAAGVITHVAEAAAPTTESWSSSSTFSWDGKDPDLSVDFANVSVSHDYGATIGWELVHGRDFNKQLATDSSALIINEAAADFMGFGDAVGQTIRWYGVPYVVVGVVKDIVTNSPFEPVRPTIYSLDTGSGNFTLFRIHPEQTGTLALTRIEAAYRKYNPDQPFTFRFVDEAYARKFSNEDSLGKLAGVFTILAIFISCLGIFGLASFVAERRTKEIGIRKVHGATVLQVWTLVSSEFVLLVGISCAIALPVGYYLALQWVSRYHYRMNVSMTILAIAALAILVVTLITVSWHTIHAAKMNPVRSLRSE